MEGAGITGVNRVLVLTLHLGQEGANFKWNVQKWQIAYLNCCVGNFALASNLIFRFFVHISHGFPTIEILSFRCRNQVIEDIMKIRRTCCGSFCYVLPRR